jgi:hypothetical protein
MTGHELTLMSCSVHQDPLDQIVAVLISRYYMSLLARPTEENKRFPLTVNQWHPRSFGTTSAYTGEIAVQELGAPDLQTFLDDFGCKLIHAVIHSMVEYMLNRTTLVVGSAMLTYVLDAPVAELAMSKQINLCQNFFNGRSLLRLLVCLSRYQGRSTTFD